MTGTDDFFLGQQSLTCVNEILTLPLFKQTILFMVKPRLDSKNTIAKNTAVVFLIDSISVTNVQNQFERCTNLKMWQLLYLINKF